MLGLVPSISRIQAIVWSVFGIFAGILIGYLLRNDVVVGCLVGMAVCLIIEIALGLWVRYGQRKAASTDTRETASPVKVMEGWSFTVPVGSAGMYYLIQAVAASVTAIVDDFQAITGQPISPSPPFKAKRRS
jgi:hypothetical protein